MKSRRFRPTRLTHWAVPALIALLLAAMLFVFAVVALSLLGFKL